MSFYCDYVIICGKNERAHSFVLAGAEGFSSAGRGGPSPEPPAAPPGGNPFLTLHPRLSSRPWQKELLEVILGSAGK